MDGKKQMLHEFIGSVSQSSWGLTALWPTPTWQKKWFMQSMRATAVVFHPGSTCSFAQSEQGIRTAKQIQQLASQKWKCTNPLPQRLKKGSITSKSPPPPKPSPPLPPNGFTGQAAGHKLAELHQHGVKVGELVGRELAQVHNVL